VGLLEVTAALRTLRGRNVQLILLNSYKLLALTEHILYAKHITQSGLLIIILVRIS
jgi:hypothetical protein